MLLFNAILTPFLVRLPYFNTSNVTIQHFSIEIKLISIFISIHLMLLFNINLVSLFFTILIISIHLMLLFNCFSNASSNADIIISIHLMLLFNDMWVLLVAPVLNFNTSNVTIQRLACWYRTTAQAISIHLMLLFNYLLHIHILYYKAFQYI